MAWEKDCWGKRARSKSMNRFCPRGVKTENPFWYSDISAKSNPSKTQLCSIISPGGRSAISRAGDFSRNSGKCR